MTNVQRQQQGGIKSTLTSLSLLALSLHTKAWSRSSAGDQLRYPNGS